MKIYTLATTLDWAHHMGAFGRVGITRFFDFMTQARIERVYWRCFEGGRASYPSKVAHVFRGSESPSLWQVGDGGGPKSIHYRKEIDCNQFDGLAFAVEEAHRRNIELVAWWTLSEEAHGLHLLSGFGQREDLRLHDKQGNNYPGTVEFGLKEVRDYKLAICDEILSRKPDGLLLDFVRHNATPSGDENGIHRFGYSPELRKDFKQKFGSDPVELPADDADWLAYKNGYRADFIRTIAGKLNDQQRLDVLTIPHVDNYRWLALDLPSLTADKTIDLIMPHDMVHCNSPESVARCVGQLKDQTRGRHTKVAGSVQAWWGNLATEDYEKAIKAAEAAKANALILHESDQLVRWRLMTPTRAHHLKAMACDRSVAVKRVAAEPTDKDWKGAAQYAGFFTYANNDQIKSCVKTSFKVLASPKALHVQVTMMGKQKDMDPVLLREKKQFIDWIGARNYWMSKDVAHLLIDRNASRRQFTHFVAGRDGSQAQELRADNHWNGKWQAEVTQPTNNKWQVTMSIPFASLGGKPKAGDRWGFQLIRTHADTGEVSGWFVTTMYGLDPEEWGDLVFEK